MSQTDRNEQPQHLRATPQDILWKWRNGFYTPKGYLYDLILAFRRAGWWYRIDSVTQFCDDWEIKRRTFYSAKASLIEMKLFEENIIGAVELRIPVMSASSDTTVHDDAQSGGLSGVLSVQGDALTVPDLALTVHGRALPVHDGAHSSPETHMGEGRQNSTDLSHIYTDLSHREREGRAENSFEEEEAGPATTSGAVQVTPVSLAQPATTSGGQGSASFDWVNFNWQAYESPGDGGSDPGYWDFAYDKVVAYNDRRKKNKKAQIGDLTAYTLETIRSRGSDGYRVFLVSIGVIPPDPKPDAPTPTGDLPFCEWSDEFETVKDLSDAMASVKVHWQRLKLGWQDQRWLDWLERAKALKPFRFERNDGFHQLPNWAVVKLAIDLERAK